MKQYFVWILVISLFLVGCGEIAMDSTFGADIFDWTLYHIDFVSSEGIPYEYFTIEGMPCIRLGDGDHLYSSFSNLSCDWSKWTK